MAEQLFEAAVLLGVGMLVVFSFLSLLIGGIHVITWYVGKYPGAADEQSPLHKKQIPQQNNNNPALASESSQSVNSDVIAAISVAVKRYMQK